MDEDLMMEMRSQSEIRERERMVEQIMEMINGLLPGQALKVVAHDPEKEEDKRHFTVTRLQSERDDDLPRMREEAEKAGHSLRVDKICEDGADTNGHPHCSCGWQGEKGPYPYAVEQADWHVKEVVNG